MFLREKVLCEHPDFPFLRCHKLAAEPDSGHSVVAAMESRWLPRLGRQGDEVSASDDFFDVAAAGLTSPRAYRPPPPCQVFEMFSDGSGRESAPMAHGARTNATTAQQQHSEIDLDVPLTDAAPIGFCDQEPHVLPNGHGSRPTALHPGQGQRCGIPGVHGPGTLQRSGHLPPSRLYPEATITQNIYLVETELNGKFLLEIAEYMRLRADQWMHLQTDQGWSTTTVRHVA